MSTDLDAFSSVFFHNCVSKHLDCTFKRFNYQAKCRIFLPSTEASFYRYVGNSAGLGPAPVATFSTIFSKDNIAYFPFSKMLSTVVSVYTNYLVHTDENSSVYIFGKYALATLSAALLLDKESSTFMRS